MFNNILTREDLKLAAAEILQTVSFDRLQIKLRQFTSNDDLSFRDDRIFFLLSLSCTSLEDDFSSFTANLKGVEIISFEFDSLTSDNIKETLFITPFRFVDDIQLTSANQLLTLLCYEITQI